MLLDVDGSQLDVHTLQSLYFALRRISSLLGGLVVPSSFSLRLLVSYIAVVFVAGSLNVICTSSGRSMTVYDSPGPVLACRNPRLFAE